MAVPSITQTEFYAIVNGNTHGKFSQVVDRQVTSNRAVRFVVGDVDLRSHKRSAQLTPNLTTKVYEYTAPTDIKGEKVIDIRRQVNRPSYEKFRLVDDSEFDRRKEFGFLRVAVRDENYGKILRVDGLDGGTSIILHNCDSITSNGTWVASVDASNITLDSIDYITNKSLNFDLASGASTAVLTNSAMSTAVDLSDYDEQGSVYMWVFIPTDVTIANITNFILRWGNDSSNYWSKTVTTNNEGNTFTTGWNLLRFDWTSATETGTVVPATIDYLVFTITKAGGEAANTDWRIDDITFRKGSVYYLVYYTKYGWQTTAGAYIEESTTTTDLVVADTEEIEGIAFKASEFAAQELKEYDDVKYFRQMYTEWKSKYQTSNPSEALKKQRSYTGLPRYRR